MIATAELVVPHPGLHERGFVLAPLTELAPEARHPMLGLCAGEIAEDADLSGLVHLAAWDAAAGAWEAIAPEEPDEAADPGLPD